ncbi:hypothetical protein DICPUDRAFT_159026 [Dictyostelium purpureum]|uniref:Ankyrin repeat protein n=1 Tax=Dictyostelium purpureum TaxID=5786 RepID=F1A331_DICPU|nr:uncharacterized protein DICPUDRAFT_159026 [Dictyostelium purpureum]EGC29404.1 hypothetical protein DICPUDRAFT_159026 [Dictyostelium purpureum]|eukprot:XP_003294075.1 hypothetical protein DICPUDRAFT_159026 [Dictyostelium purpureum]
MYDLYKKVFNNKFLSNIIFQFVQINKKRNSQYKLLEDIDLYYIFSNKKLFQLKYESYKYYRNYVGDREKSDLVFIDILNGKNLRYFFESTFIPLEIFIEIYQNYKELLRNVSKSFEYILDYLVLCKEKSRVEYFINNEDFRFDIECYSDLIELLVILKPSNDIDHYKPLLDFYISNNIPLKTSSNIVIKSVSNTESLKYLLKMQNKFTPSLNFNWVGLKSNALVEKDFTLFQFIDKEFYSEVKNMSKNTSFEIFKYIFDKDDGFKFDDIAFHIAYNGELEYAQFIVEKFKNKDPRVQLSYRSLNWVTEKGYTHIAEYLFKEIGYLGVSRDVINNSIKTGDFKLINLFKNVPSTNNNSGNFSIYETTLNFIKYNNRKDILNILLNDCIYSSYFLGLKDQMMMME